MILIPQHLVSVVERAIERELAADRALPEGMITQREREAEPMAVLIVSLGQAQLLLDGGNGARVGSSVHTSVDGGSGSSDSTTARTTPTTSERANGGSLIPPVVDPAHTNVRGANGLGGPRTPSLAFPRPLGAT